MSESCIFSHKHICSLTTTGINWTECHGKRAEKEQCPFWNGMKVLK